jgi:hypothetical protein
MKKLSTYAIALLLPLLVAGCYQRTPASHPQFGKETWVGIAALAGTVDAGVNGAALGHYFEKGEYVLSVQLNIDKAPKGKEYHVWLEKDASTDRMYAGELQSPTGDVRHVLNFSSATDLRAYRTVIVALQDAGKISIPGQILAKGTLEDAKK